MKKSAMDKYVIVGYSGHSYVVCDILLNNQTTILGYCEKEQKEKNPYKLDYLGQENSFNFEENKVFIAIGDNNIRAKIYNNLYGKVDFGNAYHKTSYVGFDCKLGDMVMIGPAATINALSIVGNGVIVNTQALIEHECTIGDFSHIAPGAVLSGNVTIGKRCFIGANSVVKQGVEIGDDVVIGAGTVIIRDVPSRSIVVGNPGKNIEKT